MQKAGVLTHGYLGKNWQAWETFKHIENDKKVYKTVKCINRGDARERNGTHGKTSKISKLMRNAIET